MVPRQAAAHHFHLPAAVLLGAGGIRLEGWQPPPQCSQRRATQVRGIHGMLHVLHVLAHGHAICCMHVPPMHMQHAPAADDDPSSIFHPRA